MAFSLMDFVQESNRIEGITRPPFGYDPTLQEIEEHEWFLNLSEVTVEDLQRFVFAIQPGAVLRDQPGMNVQVGGHVAPAGGPDIVRRLQDLLFWANKAHIPHPQSRGRDAYNLHLQYEGLHPFMDGNGRSGRVLWLWMVGGIEVAPLGFLHQFYYDTLADEQTR